MKVLMLINSFSCGGGEKVFLNLADYFVSHQVNITYVVGCDVGVNKKILNENIKKISLSKKPTNLNILFSSWKFIKILNEEKPEIVISTLELSNVINLCYVSLYNFFTRKKIKIVLREANTLTSLDGKQKKSISTFFLDFILNRFSNFSDFVICNSPDTKKDVMLIRGIKDAKSKVIQNPVLNNDNYIKKKKIRYDNKIRIISVGRLTYQKNHIFLIDVVNELISDGFNIQLDIYGTGELYSEILEYIKSMNLSGNVDLKGYSDNINAIYSDYDIFCLSSRWEGFGNVLVEALASGLPLLSLNCPGGPSYIIENEECGMIAKNSVEDYKSKLLMLVENESEDKINARILLSNKYRDSFVAKIYLDTLKSVCDI